MRWRTDCYLFPILVVLCAHPGTMLWCLASALCYAGIIWSVYDAIICYYMLCVCMYVWCRRLMNGAQPWQIYVANNNAQWHIESSWQCGMIFVADVRWPLQNDVHFTMCYVLCVHRRWGACRCHSSTICCAVVREMSRSGPPPAILKCVWCAFWILSNAAAATAAAATAAAATAASLCTNRTFLFLWDARRARSTSPSCVCRLSSVKPGTGAAVRMHTIKWRVRQTLTHRHNWNANIARVHIRFMSISSITLTCRSTREVCSQQHEKYPARCQCGATALALAVLFWP